MSKLSDDAKRYYEGGFRRSIGGVPCKVFSKRTQDGRYVRAKDSPHYDPTYDHPTKGASRTNPLSEAAE